MKENSFLTEFFKMSSLGSKGLALHLNVIIGYDLDFIFNFNYINIIIFWQHSQDQS